MTINPEERARELRELLAKAIHTENGECDCDDFWDDITEAGYECGCFQLADAVLKSEWLTQVQAEARLEPKHAKLAIMALQHYKTTCSKSGPAFIDSVDSTITALAQAAAPAKETNESPT